MEGLIFGILRYLTSEIREETHLREICYGILIFRQSSMICIGRHVGGHTLVNVVNILLSTPLRAFQG